MRKNRNSRCCYNFGLFQWNDNKSQLKLKCGKRLALKILILEKAKSKWNDYNSDCYDEEAEYVLTLATVKGAQLSLFEKIQR